MPNFIKSIHANPSVHDIYDVHSLKLGTLNQTLPRERMFLQDFHHHNPTVCMNTEDCRLLGYDAA